MIRSNPKSKKQQASILSDTQKLSDALTALEQIAVVVGPSPALTAIDRQRATKLRKGGETVIPTVATLSDHFGVQVASHPTGAMLVNRDKAQSLIPIHKRITVLLSNVEDVMFKANSDSWEAATVHYSMLKRLSRKNGDLQTALAPLKEFFAKKSAAVVKAREAKTGHRKGGKASASQQQGGAIAVHPASSGNAPAITTPHTAAVVIADSAAPAGVATAPAVTVPSVSTTSASSNAHA